MESIKCFFFGHIWSVQYDLGRDSAVKMTAVEIWMSDIKVKCGHCGKVRQAQRKEDHDLPEHQLP